MANERTFMCWRAGDDTADGIYTTGAKQAAVIFARLRVDETCGNAEVDVIVAESEGPSIVRYRVSIRVDVSEAQP